MSKGTKKSKDSDTRKIKQVYLSEDGSEETEVTTKVIARKTATELRKLGFKKAEFAADLSPADPGADGWKKVGDDGEATQDDQPGSGNGGSGSHWEQEGESETINT